MRLAVLSTLMLALGALHATETGLRPGGGVAFRNEDGSATLGIGGRLQVRHTYMEAADSGTFDVPRLRLSLKGSVRQEWKWEVQADFAKKEKATLKDGFVERALGKNAGLRAGQFKAAFDRQQLESSGRQAFADRSIVAGALGLGRDVGVQLQGRAANRRLAYSAGLFNGSGEGTPSASGGHMAVARVSVQPLGEFALSQGDIQPSPRPLVYVDAAAYHRQDESAGSLDGTTGIALGTGLKVAGLYVGAEGIHKQATGRADAQGWHAQAGYMVLPGRLELAARHAWLDPDRSAGGDARTESLAGANLFFANAGHDLKLTVDVARLADAARAGDDRNQYRTRTQLQLVF